MSPIWILFIAIAIAGWAVQATLQSRFKKYSKIPLRNGMTGREVAEKMLHDNGIFDVQVISVKGRLTDHYNPFNKTINLSEPVWLLQRGSCCCRCPENGTCATACQGVCTPEDAVGTGSRCLLHLQVGDVGNSGGIIMIRGPSGIDLDWYRHVRPHHTLQFCHLPVEKNATNRALVWPGYRYHRQKQP